MEQTSISWELSLIGMMEKFELDIPLAVQAEIEKFPQLYHHAAAYKEMYNIPNDRFVPAYKIAKYLLRLQPENTVKADVEFNDPIEGKTQSTIYIIGTAILLDVPTPENRFSLLYVDRMLLEKDKTDEALKSSRLKIQVISLVDLLSITIIPPMRD